MNSVMATSLADSRCGVASCSSRCAVVPKLSLSQQLAGRLRRPGHRAPARCVLLVCAAAPPEAAATAAAAAADATLDTTPSPFSAYDDLLRWCIEQHQLPPTAIEPTEVEDNVLGGQRVGFKTTRFVPKGEVLLEIPGDLGVTRVDVEADALLAPLAEGRSELVGLALWLMQERARGTTSPWAPLLATLPAATDTPVLWDEDERRRLLAGSPVEEEAGTRAAALAQEWAGIAAAIDASESAYQPAIFNERAFQAAMSVVLAQAAYLPSAQCFALLPLVGGLARTGSAGGALLDYDLERQAVTVRSAQPLGAGQDVALFDGRPNGELLLATGRLEPGNPADCLLMQAGLVAADRMYMLKKQIVEDVGFGATQEFPITQDGLTTQQLVYLRLARVQDPAQLAKISFDRDDIITQENEYEVLQLMMADLRDRLQAYPTEADDDIKDLQRQDLTVRERLAALLRLGEKRILRGTMGGVRRRLAPIRGIPTKGGGMQDPNADLAEIFDTIESIPSAPVRLLEGIGRWWSGKDDPDWKK